MVKRNIIGDRVRLGRKKAKPPITQLDLAAKLQVEGLRLEQAAISKIEAGNREVTDIEVAVIAKVLGVTIGWLFSSEEGEEHQS